MIDSTFTILEPNRACAVCGSNDRRLLFEQRFTELSAGSLLRGYNVVVCSQCGFGYADNIPQQAVFDRYYQEMSKYEYQERGGQESPFDLLRFQAIANTIKLFLHQPQARILDVGCATGRLLSLLKESGYNQVTGLDPSPVCARAAAELYGIPVITGSLSDIEPGAEPFDLLILSGVLEHIRDLDAALATMRGLLASDGLIFVEVPDATQFAHWPDAPFQEFSTEHINFFSDVSLTNFMEQHGFELLTSQQNAREQSHSTVMPVVTAIYRHTGAALRPLTRGDTATEPGLLDYINQSRRVELRLHETIDRLVKGQQPVVVWGVGTHTQRLLATSRLAQARVTAYVDSNRRYQGKQLNGVEIISPDCLAQRREPILISSRVFQQDIARQIRVNLNLNNELILLYDI